LSGEDFDLAARAPFQLAARSAQDLITPAQQERTLRNTIDLLDIAAANRTTGGELTKAGQIFRGTAVQMMQQAGDPFLVIQGDGCPTCGLSNFQFRSFLRQPDEATRMISEVLRTGKFVTRDNSAITLDHASFKANEGSLDPLLRGRWGRDQEDYASRLFQMTAGNIHWQRVVELEGRSIPKGAIRLENTMDLWDPLQLVDYSGKEPHVLSDEAAITHPQMGEIGEQIGGPAMRPTFIKESSDVLRNQRSFYNHLKQLKYPEDFPVFVTIDGTALAMDRVTAQRANHSISILSPKAIDGRIPIRNHWYRGEVRELPKWHLFELTPRLVYQDGKVVLSRTRPVFDGITPELQFPQP
jgi:hypothetical protein